MNASKAARLFAPAGGRFRRSPRALRCVRSAASTDVPFYGLPRSQTQPPASHVALFLENAIAAVMDPTRADAVAAVGELTGAQALRRLHRAMLASEDGRTILRERPLVSKETIPYDALLASGASFDATPADQVTFGQAYGAFLRRHGFDPDARDAVRYIADPDLAYVMLRYRQSHDYWHALTALPPTVLGELGLKWLELLQTGLPLAALSCTAGSLRLTPAERRMLWQVYLPWAQRVARRLEFGALLAVHYEREWDTPLAALRARLGVEPAPEVDLDSRHE